MEHMDYRKENLNNKIICLSGFELQTNDLKKTLTEKYNVTFTDITTHETELLIVRDIDKPYPSSKVKTALKYSIPIIDYSQIIK
tara:strand:- start:183 stop:434 length:252 start_codon:yes stop_codon:yes gene_type:complete